MNEPRHSPGDENDDDPRRRLGIRMSREDEDPATMKRKVLKDRLAIAGAVLLFLFLMLFMFTDAVENFQCSPWDFVTFKCNRFDAKFKRWDQETPEQAK